MKKIVLLLLICFMGMFIISGCSSDSNCNARFGTAPVPPEPEPKVISYTGFYYVNNPLYPDQQSIFLHPYANIEVVNPMVKGGADELFLATPDYERFVVYSKLMQNAVFGTFLDMPLFIPSSYEPYYNYAGNNFYSSFRPIPYENAFYAYPAVVSSDGGFEYDYRSVSYNYFENGTLCSKQVALMDEEDSVLISYSPSDKLLYVSSVDGLKVYSKTGTGSSAVHTLIDAIDDLAPVAELDKYDGGIILDMLAAPNASVYISYMGYIEHDGSMDIRYNVLKLAKVGGEYKFAGNWNLFSKDGVTGDDISFFLSGPETAASFLRIAEGPEGKIICTAPAINGVKLLNPANGEITTLPAPTGVELTGLNLYYLSSAYNETTGNIYVLALTGIWEPLAKAPSDISFSYGGFPTTGIILEYKYE